MDSNLIGKTKGEEFVIFVTISTSDGIENTIQPWNYFFHTHAQMDTLLSVDTKWVVTL